MTAAPLIHGGRRSPTPEEMILHIQQNTKRDGECLVWVGATNLKGLPVTRWRKKVHLAKRLYYTLKNGELGKKRVYSSCGNKACVADVHLREGTPHQVQKAAHALGFYRTGNGRSMAQAVRNIATAKLPITEFANVCRMRTEGMTYKQIGAVYGVTRGTASQSHRRWLRMGMTPSHVAFIQPERSNDQ